MVGFRILVAGIMLTIVCYTLVVVGNHGLAALFPTFFGDINKMGWPGQFNLDFLGFLTLSGFWLAWRHHFSPGGLALGLLGFFGGAPLLTAYLLVVSFQTNGDMAEILLGKARAQRAGN